MDLFTIRDTSKEAYEYIVDNGILSRKSLEVYEALYHKGEMTSSETLSVLLRTGKNYCRENPNVHSILCHLRNLDLVEEKGTKICSITGRNVILWKVTGRYPKRIKVCIDDEITKLDFKISKLQAKKEKLIKLRGE